MGYRLPGAVLSLANRLLARAAPGIAPSRSVRPDGDDPDLHRVAAGELVDQVADHAVALVAGLATVAVIAMPARVDELRAALEARGVALAEPGEVEPDRPIVSGSRAPRKRSRVRRRDRGGALGDRGGQ